MRLADRAAQAIRRRRHGDEVDVIWRQATAQDFHAVLATPFGQEFEVGGVVSLVEEHLLAAVSALCYLVGHPGYD